MDRCNRVENAHAFYHVDARVHVKPVFSGGVIICWRCPSQSNGTIKDDCVSVTALRQSLTLTGRMPRIRYIRGNCAGRMPRIRYKQSHCARMYATYTYVTCRMHTVLHHYFLTHLLFGRCFEFPSLSLSTVVHLTMAEYHYSQEKKWRC